jgi:RHS repeat-associated protein
MNIVREIPAATGTQWGQAMTANDIYTVAGNVSAAGSGGSSGDGGPATSALLNYVGGLAIDSAGDLYIADTSNNRIQEVPAASGTQWGQSMTAGDMYTVTGASMTAGDTGDGGTASAAEVNEPVSVSLDPSGDVLIPDAMNNSIREVFATTSQLFTTSPAGTGTTVNQADGSQVTFYPQSGGTCTAPYVTAGGSGYCTLPQDTSAGLTYSSAAGTYAYTPSPGTSYTYSASTGALKSESDSAGDTLTVTAGSPSPGSGNCPSSASSCTTITAASGRTLVLGYSSGGLVTSATDPLGRRRSYAYNTTGQLTSATDPMSNVTSYTYGAGSTGNPQLANDLLTITGPNAQPGGPDAGKSTVNVYDSLGRVTSQTDPTGYQTTFNYCANAAAGDCMNPATGTGLVTVSDPDGNSTVYSYQQGTLAARANWTGTALTTERDYLPEQTTSGTQLVTYASDGVGNITHTVYANGNPISTTAPDGVGNQVATTTQQFTSLAQADCASDANAASTCAQSAGPAAVAPGGVITPPSSIPPLGITWTLYDTNGNELYTTAGVYPPGGNTASYAHTTYQLFRGNSVTLSGTTVSCAATPPAPTLPCATINADAVVTQLQYNSYGDLVGSSTPDGNGAEVATTTYAYDGDGAQARITSPNGNLPGANAGNYTTTTSYNADGEKTSVTQAGGSGATFTARTTNYGYDSDGNQTTVQDARGYITTTTYNADDRSTLVTDPDGNATLTCYDPEGHIAQTVPPAGVAAGNLTEASCPSSYPSGYGARLASDATVYTYNGYGEKTAMSTPAPAGQTGPQTTTYSYDGNGNLTQVTAPPASNGGPSQVTVDVYNSTDQLVSQTTAYGTPAAATYSYCYDPNGDRTSVVYPDGNVSGVAPCETSAPWVVNSATNPMQAACQTTSSYDSAMELISTTAPATTTAPSGATTGSTYDAEGNLLSRTDPNGVATTWTYSPLGKPTSVTYSGSSAHPVTSTYDANGELTGRTDASGTSSYTLDPFGELTSTTNGAGQAIGYGYDANGDTTSITYPLPATATWANTSTVAYGYDHADRVTALTDFNGHTVTISNTTDGQPSSATLGTTGDTVTTTYDGAGVPSAIALKNSTATLQSFGYADAPAGNILSETDTPASPQSPAVYTYDAKGRVASMTPGSGSALSYGFDPSGNLTTLPTGGTATYDNAGELASSALSGTTTSYAYNAAGQRLTAAQGSTTVASGTWNGATELTAYSDSAASMGATAYDASGLRASTTITPSGQSATTQQYAWNANAALPEMIMDSSNAYLYGNGVAPIEQVSLSTGGITYLVTDSLGSVRGAVSSTGAVLGTASYDAWGNPQTAGGLTATTPFGFAGGYTDPTGLIYLTSRYYDPSTGQFLSVDPDIRSTLQAYAYTEGNPVSQTDPTGLVNLNGVAAWARANVNGSNNGWADDCTDFASRALYYGGGDRQTWPTSGGSPIAERSDDWYWYNGSWWGVPVKSYSWGGAFNLADHESEHGARFLGYASDAKPGDIISVNLSGTAWHGIDHTGVITAMQNGVPVITQHSRSITESLHVWQKDNPHMTMWIWTPANG